MNSCPFAATGVVVGPALLADGSPILAVLTVCELHKPDVARWFTAFSEDWFAAPIEALPDVLAELDDDYLDTGASYWMPESVPA